MILLKTAEITLINPVGLHARPAAFFVQLANEFEAEITVECNNRSADAKSILDILSLGAIKGSSVKITTEGLDEEKALEKLVTAIKEGLGEEV